MDEEAEGRVGEVIDGPAWADDEVVSSRIRRAVLEEIERKRRDGLPVVVNRGHGVEILQPGQY